MFVVWSIIQWQNLFFGKCFAAWSGWRRIQKSQICFRLLREVVNCSGRRTEVCLVKELSHKKWWSPGPFFLQYHIPSQTHIFNLSWSESKFQCYNHIARSLGRILNIQYNQFSCMTSKSGNQVCSYPYSWFLLFSQQYMSKTESSSKNLLYLWF